MNEQRENNDEEKLRLLICEFLTLFYKKDWVTGTGGGIAASLNGTEVLMAPTGVHKERVLPDDLFVVSRQNGEVIRPPQNRSLRLSECAPIFCQILNQRGAGSVMHSHALSSVLASDIAEEKDYLVIESLEMLKGVYQTNQNRHFVPIINNTLHERELTRATQERLGQPDFSGAYCILVRDHGAYIWGKDIWETKRHAEVYHFLFEAMIARKQMRGGGLSKLPAP